MLQQVDAALQRLHQLLGVRDVARALLGQKVRGAVHVQRLLGGGVLEVGEGARELVDERALDLAQLRVGDAAGGHPSTQPEAGQALVEIARGPLDQSPVDVGGEVEDALGDAAVGGDHDHHHAAGLQQQHLDAVDRRRAQGWRADQRDQVGDPRQRRGGLPDRLLDLAPHPRQAQLALRLGRQSLGRRPAAARRRSGSPHPWEPCPPRCADARGSPGPPGSPARSGSSRRSTPTRGRRDQLRADGLAVAHVAGNDRSQDQALAFVEHEGDSRVAPRPFPQAAPRWRAWPRRCG